MRSRQITGLLAAGSLLALSGCSEPGDGVLQLALTDAPEDFITYAVDVKQINLVRRDGTKVAVLPETARVDFVEYQELSEFFTVRTVPSGTYQQIDVVLDYTDAELSVEGYPDQLTGIPPVLAVAQGNITFGGNQDEEAVRISMMLPDDGFVIRPGIPASLTLDFDLAASNRVTIENDTVSVEVEPVLLADAQFDGERELRVRGLLDSVSPELDQFQLAVKPLRFRNGNYGNMTVHVTDQTRFEIDGAICETACLDQLALLEQGRPVIGYGKYYADAGEYRAEQIMAGSSVPWDGMDLLRGVISSRVSGPEGDVITLRGAVIEPDAQRAMLSQEIQLQVDKDYTRFNGWSHHSEVSLADLNVGARIHALGQFDATADDTVFDATGESGLVRLKQNRLAGTIIDASINPVDSQVSLNLLGINGRHISHFDFATTGTEPASLLVDLNGLPLAEDTTGCISVRGAFGQYDVPDADFSAQSLIVPGDDNYRAVMVAEWEKGTTPAIIQSGEQWQLVDAQQKLRLAGVSSGCTQTHQVTYVESRDANKQLFVIKRGGWLFGGSDIFTDYDAFSARLAEDLEDGWQARRLVGHGEYDQSLQTMALKRAVVVLKLLDQ